MSFATEPRANHILTEEQSMSHHDAATHYRTQDVNGLKIFYREAGSPAAPTILLLHGFPTSSHMFRDLIPLLAPHYHVIAPDLPDLASLMRRPRPALRTPLIGWPT
jgi:alpha-beta hydrolase superfamily lysophospholipase